MSSSIQAGTLGSKLGSCGQAIIRAVKWCGKEITLSVKSHIIPRTTSVWKTAIGFLSTGFGLGVTSLLLGFCIVAYASTQSIETHKIAFSITGILFIGLGISSIIAIGPAALI